nr:pentapeptide repeat-containing protein [Leptolyngbya ohadii]
MLSWGENQAFISLLGLLGNLGLLFAALTYIGLEQQRRESQIYLAWQTITNAQGQSGNGGRILALEFLNASPGANWRLHFPWICVSEDRLCSRWESESLDGVDLERAYLAKVQLPGANLLEANLQGAVLWQANLQGARLVEANLQGARLGGANLQGAKLDGANLQGAVYSDEKTPKNICLDITYPPVYPCPTQFPDGFDAQVAGMKLLR